MQLYLAILQADELTPEGGISSVEYYRSLDDYF